MDGKSNGIALVVASVILGGSLFGAAMVNKGLILQKEPEQPKENILSTTVGHVNLGKVYREARGMDITLKAISNDNSSPIINLNNVNPSDFSSGVHDALVKLATDLNKAQNLTGDKAYKAEDLSGKMPFELKISTFINYSSEYAPNYTLTIDDKKITIDPNIPFEARVNAEASDIAKESAPSFAANSFIKDPSR